MPYNELNSANIGSNTSTFTSYSVDSKTLDSPSGQKEYEYINSKASKQLGYYKTIPELKVAIDTKATWTIGKGFESNELTTILLRTIKGQGKDTFNSMLENLIREYHIYGDSFAEIIRSGNRLVNIKPIDPSKVKIISNSKGIIIRYEITSGQGTIKFKPEDILHLSRNRIADEIHGISIVDSVEWIILARNEAMEDYKKLLHRNVYPLRLWELDTDIESKISEFKGKVANAKYKGEDMFMPKGVVSTGLATVSQNSSLNPLPWIQILNQYFYQAVGVPQIIIGGSQELTQTAAQIAYLAFEQTIEEEQLFIEEQLLSQLNLEVQLTFPASLQNNLLSDSAKDGTMEQQLNQPSNLAPPLTRTGVVQ